MEQLHQNSLKIVSAAGVKVSVKLRHETVSRPQPPAQPDCFNLYLDSPAHDRDGHMASVWGHFLNRAIFVIESSPR